MKMLEGIILMARNVTMAAHTVLTAGNPPSSAKIISCHEKTKDFYD